MTKSIRQFSREINIQHDRIIRAMKSWKLPTNQGISSEIEQRLKNHFQVVDAPTVSVEISTQESQSQESSSDLVPIDYSVNLGVVAPQFEDPLMIAQQIVNATKAIALSIDVQVDKSYQQNQDAANAARIIQRSADDLQRKIDIAKMETRILQNLTTQTNQEAQEAMSFLQSLGKSES
jgi:hypothetical protein